MIRSLGQRLVRGIAATTLAATVATVAMPAKAHAMPAKAHATQLEQDPSFKEAISLGMR